MLKYTFNNDNFRDCINNQKEYLLRIKDDIFFPKALKYLLSVSN